MQGLAWNEAFSEAASLEIFNASRSQFEHHKTCFDECGEEEGLGGVI